MIWIPIIELDIIIGFGSITVFGLSAIKNQHINQVLIKFACLFWLFTPLLHQIANIFDSEYISANLTIGGIIIETSSYDILLMLVIIIVIKGFKNFESLLLLIIAFVAQYIIIHSVDLIYFYISLEAQNFCFLVICGLQSSKQSASFTVEASLKYLLLSALSSGVLLFAIAGLYLQTGQIGVGILTLASENTTSSYLIVVLLLTAMLFKLGAAPLHLWIVYIYASVSKPLLIYISTAPKLALFHFWASSWQLLWIDNTLGIYVLFSIILGSLGAYGYANNPSIRSLFAYSTISEIGLILLAIETAGFHSLFQHLSIYMLTQVLLWNLNEKRLFSVAAISLAGLPPLAGFFGKAWIIWHSTSIHIVTYVIVALISSLIAIVYNIRLIRLIWLKPTYQTLIIIQEPHVILQANEPLAGWPKPKVAEERIKITSFCVISLLFLPLFLIKPFVL